MLCYHAVDPAWRSPLAITPAAFARHAAWLARARTVLPLDVAVRRVDRSGRLPPRQTALTFDDGFAGLIEYVLPQVLRHRLHASVFIVAATLTPEGHPVDWVDTPPPWPLRTVSTEEVIALRDAGVTIGSHSWSHRILPRLGEAECHDDLRRSRELLEDLLHEPVRTLAYPRGLHAPHVRRAARRAGFEHALTLPVRRERPGPLSLPRVGVYPDNGLTTLRVKTTRAYLGVRMSRAYPWVRLALKGRRPPAAPDADRAVC